MAERFESPFGNGMKRIGSSPPSPVFDLPPMRFIAMASVSCASVRDRAEAHRAGDRTAARCPCSGLDFLDRHRTTVHGVLNVIRPRSIELRVCSWFVDRFEKRQYASSLLVRAATCSSAIAVGSHMWRSPPSAPMEIARIRQHRQRDHVAARIAEPMPALQSLRRGCRNRRLARGWPCLQSSESITSSARPIASKICAPL